MKILNLFAGIGGNRTLWGNQHEITAIEFDQQKALVYLKRFPKDIVIIADAYEYFINNFPDFDFIWASPPCPSHTIMNSMMSGLRYNGKKNTMHLPDLRLFSIILFLKHHFRGDWVVENVIPYYKCLVAPTATIGRHYIWSNINIPDKESIIENIIGKDIHELCKIHHIKYSILDDLKGANKAKIIKNCVQPGEGKYLLDFIINKHKVIGIDDFFK